MTVELPAGTAHAFNWQVGDQLRLIAINKGRHWGKIKSSAKNGTVV